MLLYTLHMKMLLISLLFKYVTASPEYVEYSHPKIIFIPTFWL